MKYFEDYELGEKIITRKRTITETDVVVFCMFSGDWYPLHSDMEFAKQTMSSNTGSGGTNLPLQLIIGKKWPKGKSLTADFGDDWTADLDEIHWGEADV